MVPNVFSCFVKNLGNNLTLKNAASGGTEIADCVAVPGTKFHWFGFPGAADCEAKNIAVPATSAVLFTGPPRSTQIIAATIAPNKRLPPCNLLIAFIPSNNHFTGNVSKGPIAYLPASTINNTVNNGQTIKSTIPLKFLCIYIFFNQ